MSGPVLRLEAITKRFSGLAANDAIDLALDAGEVLALLGENGAGKTTLMSILFGHYTADAGRVLVADATGALAPLPPGSPRAALAAGIGMVHQHFTLADNLTALDNVLLGTEPLWRWRSQRAAARARLRALEAESGLAAPLDVPVGRLSVGERQRVEILKALYRGARILILDEPTAVLTPPETLRLFEVLRRLTAGGMAILLISHKLPEVMAISDRVAVLRAGRKVLETATAATGPAALAAAMVGREVPERRRTPLAPGPPLVELRAVRVSDGRAVLEIAELVLHAREILGIAGVSGNGQGLLAGLLAGTHRPVAGAARLRGAPWPTGGPAALRRAGVGRIPEDRHGQGIVGELTVAENLVLEDYRAARFQRWGLLRRAAVRRHAAAQIAAHDLRCWGPDQPARLLSGGNMQKLILARVLEGAPAVILADQPSRGLDVGAVAEVHRRLLDARERGAAILMIAEDLDELLALADRIAVIYRGRLGPARPVGAVDRHELGLAMAGGGDAAQAA